MRWLISKVNPEKTRDLILKWKQNIIYTPSLDLVCFMAVRVEFIILWMKFLKYKAVIISDLMSWIFWMISYFPYFSEAIIKNRIFVYLYNDCMPLVTRGKFSTSISQYLTRVGEVYFPSFCFIWWEHHSTKKKGSQKLTLSFKTKFSPSTILTLITPFQTKRKVEFY